MQLVDVQWLIIAPGALLYPLFIGELVLGQITDNRAGTGTQFNAEAIGVAVFYPTILFVHLSRLGIP